MAKSLEQYMPDESRTHYRFMKYRIHKILLVCCSYDGYILEEDGHIESQINQEYLDLNMSNPPSFTRVSSTREALEALAEDDSYDFILTMYNVGEPDVFTFAKLAKERHPQIPIALLTSFSKDIYRRLGEQDRSGLDYIFCWHGNTDLIIAIIKLVEDKMNAEEDISVGGVQAILLVEDSIRFYSTYLPELYKLILLQNTEFLKDAFNEQQQVLRKRARPKILLARCYEEAVELYDRYKQNLLGVISDVGFVLHREDPAESEKPDAGIDLCRRIKNDNPLMPVLLQSSQTAFSEQAEALGAGFIAKNSKTLLSQLHDYIDREFAFGDFVFEDPATGEEIGRARDLAQMQEMIASIPDEAFEYHTSQNHLSKWLYSRGLFPLAASIRQYNKSHFTSVEEHRRVLVNLIRDYRTLLGQGVVARFDAETYSDAIAFARIGEGSLGGKARGLAFMNSMLIKYRQYDKHEGVRIMIPRSVVIATEYFDEFIRMNGLQYVVSQEFSDEEILSEFVSSYVPPRLQQELKAYIRTVRTPLAVRSSSKLEDSHYQPFAGIYSTYMIPFTKNEDQMLRLLLRAVKSVYASVYFAASRAYIQTSQNLISEEKMAVIIQEVCGTEQDGLYFPTCSGVARSINYYPIGDERPEDGVCNVAMGLGKLVVDGGRTLRFSPRYPQKVLQTSTPELALRDTQNEVLALSLSPEEFRTSIDDAVNLHRLNVREIDGMRNARFVCSVWDRENERISDSPFDRGRKVITFNNILKYNTFPLAEIVSDILRMGTEEMRCPVEVEFAVNMDVPAGQQQIFNLLQIRPIIDNQDNRPIDWSSETPDHALIYGEQALGIGRMNDISDIVYVKTPMFDSLATEKIADELLALNARMRDEQRTYILVGPGRWGSSDPFLGVPVKWTHISEAKVIVECGIERFDVEPSQGTHFFQNVTSLGVGYLTINPFRGDGIFREDLLDARKALYEGTYLRHVRFDRPLWVCVDGRSNRGMVRETAPGEEEHKKSK
ncbi:pyruvate phosphate dikinase PEP/pyruvate binding domain protein [Alistipes sp. CAG:268]|jgi:CheY-like chemotaxis protein|uniref:PEP/pyruvate-binding domain-containing protein n=1 Tax=Alistipes sp. CAG:268 TaxID=1262693 RepID=UPI000338BD66|nr:PEP/pyruvate-binding domain-containing protein [Alistipes sp. CAG:268]CDC96297.1 pyruvate phosphate dikinase PEP/pyruvate binding domain protein [Alistipes sp. CAG:268]